MTQPIMTHVISSFIASAAFGLLFYAPRSTLFHCGFIGMTGWIIYVVCGNVADPIFSTLTASFAVTFMSYLFAKLYRTPIIVYSVSGIIPLVPGGLAYDAMLHFVQKDYSDAIGIAAQAFLLSGAIAVGLVCSEVIQQLVKKAGS